MIRILLFLLCSTIVLGADEMMKIVYRNTDPGLSSDSFAAKPKTLYRYGPTKGRVEEEPDPALKIHGLVIVNAKDIWMINLWDKSGKHITDPGPTYNFHACIAPSLGPNQPPRAKAFQIGHELAFMKEKQVEPKKTVFAGVPAYLYECEEDGLTLRTYVSADTHLPLAVSVHKGETLLASLQYDEYLPSLPPLDALFVPPSGVRFTE